MAGDDVSDRSLTALAGALRAGETTAEAIAREALARHEAVGERLDAYKTWDGERALDQARWADAALAQGRDLGPLLGVPVSLKDLYGVPGLPTFAGSPRRLPAEWERPGPAVAALLGQGAVITGKTHTVEFAFGGLGTNPHWGTPRNPWDARDHRVPGGSSAGAGVSLAEGSALVAFGTDTAGSVRIPASMTGQVGLKTTHGRWSLAGIVPLSPSLDTAGLLARSAADAAFAFAAVDPAIGPARADAFLRRLADVEAADLRLGVCDDYFWEDCSPGIAEAVEAALDELAREGARRKPVALPELPEVNRIFRKGGLVAVELYVFLSSVLPDWLDTIDDNVKQRMAEADTLTASAYLDRVRILGDLAARVDERLAAVDVLVTPTVSVTPPTLAEIAEPGAYRDANMAALRNTSVVNYLGLCAVTLPVGLDAAGMPVGLQLVARGGSDERLLAAALAIERVLGTGRERFGPPPIGGS